MPLGGCVGAITLNDGENGPRFVLPAENDKGKRERVIPVRPELVREIEAHRAECPRANPHTRICAGIFPRQRADAQRPNALRLDMAKEGIPVRDATGRVMDYRSFRLPFGSWSQGSVRVIAQSLAEIFFAMVDATGLEPVTPSV